MLKPRVHVFVDGTNVLRRFRDAKLKLTVSLEHALRYGFDPHSAFHRVCVYTTESEWQRGLIEHGPSLEKNCRPVFGDSIQGKNGLREKGVDALLVADLVYHAASKNIDTAVLVSDDSDFRFALKRVEDFGCRTALMALLVEPPERLRKACDNYRFISLDHLQANKFVLAI